MGSGVPPILPTGWLAETDKTELVKVGPAERDNSDMNDETVERKKHPLTWLDLLPLIVGFGGAIAVWTAGISWVIFR